MKFPPFKYVCPKTIDEVLHFLSTCDGEAKVIAGGQSLLPVLAFRLGAPDLIVDLRMVPGLGGIDIGPDGLYLGAKVLWRDIEQDARLISAHPLLKAAIEHVAHYQIRNRGTVGGSLAHADPAAEFPGIAVTSDASIVIVGPAGTRTVEAEQFFVGPLSTVLESSEIVIGVRFPLWTEGRRWAFEEFSRRRGDFAMAGIALFYDLDANGRATNSHVGVIGACDRPQRLRGVEKLLDGNVVDPEMIAAASSAAANLVTPPDDIHASAAYRRALVSVLLERALARTVA